MADGLSMGRNNPPPVEQQIVFNIEGMKELEKLSEALNRIARGNNLQDYWKSQEELVNDVIHYYNQYQRTLDEIDATNLINTLNALRAVMEQGTDFGDIIPNYDRMLPTLERVKSKFKEVIDEMSPEAFSGAFSSFELLKGSGLEVEKILSALANSANVSKLTNDVALLREKLAEALAELDSFKTGEQVRDLEVQMEQLREKVWDFESTAERARDEFANFLSVHDINWSSLDNYSYRDRIEELFNEIRNGSTTAHEAIAEVRSSMSDLFQQTSSYGIIDVQRLTEGIDLTNQQTVALQNMASSADGAKSVGDILATIISGFEGVSESDNKVQNLQQSLLPLLQTLNEMSHVDLQNLNNLDSILFSLNRLGNVKGSNKSLQGLVDILRLLSGNDIDLSKLAVLSAVKLGGFKGIKVSKTILNIAEMSKELNTTKLKALEGMNFENLKALTNIKVSKAAVQQISELTEAIKVLKEAKAASITATDDSVLIDETEASRAQKEAAYLKEATEALNQYYNLRKKYAALFASGDIVEDAGGFLSNTRFGEVANELNRALKTYRELTSEEELQTHKQETINKLAEQELKLRYQLNSASEIATNKAYDRADAEAQSYEKSLAAQAQAIENAYYEIEGAARKSAFKEEQLYIENATKALRGYYNTLKQLQAGFASGAITGDELTGYRTESSEYTVRVDQLNTFLQKKRELIDLEQKEGHQEETLNKITAEKERLEREVLAAKEVATNKQIALDQKQEAAANRQAAAKQSALLKAIELQSRYSLLIGKMSSEKHGAFYTSAVEDRQALDDLIQSFQNGEISLDDFKSKLQILTTSFNTTKDAVNGMSNSTMTAFQRLATMAKKFSYWFSVTRIVMAAYRAFKQMVQSSIELESTFNQLQIVTGATDAEMSKFADTAINLAKGLGQSVTDVTKAIETFSRLGYTLSEAGSLAEFATILSNVANVDLSAATTGLTSIIKGFDMEVSDAEHVSDVLINVGQKFAVSASEMMDAYERAGAALNATNTSFEKSAALIAAANASVQNANTVGTALKTISARIRGRNSASSFSNKRACA